MVSISLRRRLTGRQRQLQDELIDLVLAEGFAHLTMDHVAARLNCSKRTLYALADSRDQLATEAVKLFFRRATEQVEQAINRTRAPAKRVQRYLAAVAAALAPASRAFLDDVADFAPTREVYEANTAAAAQRVRDLITEGTEAGAFRAVRADFVAEVVTATMYRITSGEIQRSTGMGDAESYRQLAQLVVAAVRR